MSNSKAIKPSVEKPLFKVMGGMVFLLALGGSFNLAMMLIDRETPVQFITREAVEDEVPQGGILTVRFTIERNRICKSEINRWLIDSQLVKHAITSYTTALVPTLGRISDQREITIPVGAATGSAVYYVENYYYCNILQRIFEWPIIVRSPDVNFKITSYESPPIKGDGEGITPTDLKNIKEIRKLVPELRMWKFALEQNRSLQSPGLLTPENFGHK